MKNPYAAAHTKDSEVLDTEFPLVTRAQMASVLHVEQKYKPEEINQKVHSLIMARKAIGDAIIACTRAKHFNGNNEAIIDRIDDFLVSLRGMVADYPLVIKEDLSKHAVE